jgi:hypothetical protein
VTAWAAPSGPCHPPGDNACERPQEGLKGFASPRADEQVQVGAHVGEVVDSNAETPGHRSKGLAHGTLVPAKGPRPAGPVAGKNDVHGAPRAHGALEFTTPTPERAAMRRSRELGLQIARKKSLLHEAIVANREHGAMLYSIFEI